jgi:hypothetical protein
LADIIVAGNTSGAITISAPLVAGSGVLTLPTGTDTLVGKATTDTLTNKSIAATQLTGTIAAAALPAGSVLQVVNAIYSTVASSSTSTFVDTGLTASITPKFATSKILVLVDQGGAGKGGATRIMLNLLRGASVIQVLDVGIGGFTNSVANNYIGSMTIAYLDSPATTSSTAYKTQFGSYSNVASVQFQADGAASSITLMEIAV